MAVRFFVEGVFVSAFAVDFVSAYPQEGLAESFCLDVFYGHLVDLFLK